MAAAIVCAICGSAAFDVQSAAGEFKCPDHASGSTIRQGDTLVLQCNCDPGYIQAGAKCVSPMPERAALLVAAMNEISGWPEFLNQRTGNSKNSHNALPKGRPLDSTLVDLNCQFFFRALGKALADRGIPSWSKYFPLEEKGEQKADRIVAAIEASVKAGKEWEKLDSWEEAQRRANEGAIVIAGLPGDREQKKHGHIAVVVPTPPGMDWSQFSTKGHGPFVRDGNEHLYEPKDPRTGKKTGERVLHPSTWGAVRASRVMPLPQTSWYIWKG